MLSVAKTLRLNKLLPVLKAKLPLNHQKFYNRKSQYLLNKPRIIKILRKRNQRTAVANLASILIAAKLLDQNLVKTLLQLTPRLRLKKIKMLLKLTTINLLRKKIKNKLLNNKKNKTMGKIMTKYPLRKRPRRVKKLKILRSRYSRLTMRRNRKLGMRKATNLLKRTVKILRKIDLLQMLILLSIILSLRPLRNNTQVCILI